MVFVKNKFQDKSKIKESDIMYSSCTNRIQRYVLCVLYYEFDIYFEIMSNKKQLLTIEQMFIFIIYGSFGKNIKIMLAWLMNKS